MTETTETFEFQTEARQLLDLMIHSVYSHREIFLRELISNASDALDKLRFEALTNTALAPLTTDLHIRITPDAKARTLIVADNGIGMNRDELIRYLGTIAKSGTREFLAAAAKAKDSGLPPELIGQFGVGFYSSFMVADRVTVLTRRAGEPQAWRWESAGDGTFTLTPDERPEPGTTVILHLKPHDDEDEHQDFTRPWVIRSIVKKYSDFVAYPIRMQVERKQVERDADGNPKPGAEERTVVEDETLNSMKAIWIRPPAEVTEEEFKEFYHHISHDWAEPLKRISYKAEGTAEFRALLYLPSRAPFGLFLPERQHTGIHLYVKRVFIMSDCKELIPEYLRFVRGVVDSEDLSLNISRELLQKNRQIGIIRKGVTKKVLDTLKAMLADEKDKYFTFWKEFGRLIKEGVFSDADHRSALLDLCLFETTAGRREGDDAAPWEKEGMTTLKAYVERLPEGQNAIYYMSGPTRAAVEGSPHLEAFREKGCEVLILTDPVDEVWPQVVAEYAGKKLVCVGKGEAAPGTEEERKKAAEELKEKSADFKPLTDALARALEDRVKEVRLSARLTSSPACLVGDEFDISPRMEALLKAAGQEVTPSKRILELNPSHPVVERLREVCAADATDPRVAEYGELLYGCLLYTSPSPRDS